MPKKRQLTLEWCARLGRDPSHWEPLYNQIWRNIRPEGGYRLTPFGKDILDDLSIQSWNIKIKNTQATAGNTLLGMDRYLEHPYFVDTKRNILIVYSEELATQILLYDGDLGSFLAAQTPYIS